MVNQMMMQRLKRQYSVLIVDSYLQMYETDTHGVYCSICLKIENLYFMKFIIDIYVRLSFDYRII